MTWQVWGHSTLNYKTENCELGVIIKRALNSRMDQDIKSILGTTPFRNKTWNIFWNWISGLYLSYSHLADRFIFNNIMVTLLHMQWKTVSMCIFFAEIQSVTQSNNKLWQEASHTISRPKMQTAFSSRQGQNLLHWNFYFKEQTNKNPSSWLSWVYKVKLTVCSAVEINWNIICPCLPALPQSGLLFRISETIHIPNIPKPFCKCWTEPELQYI